MADEQKERAEFEAWATMRGFDEFECNAGGFYMFPALQHCWSAWQSRAALAASPAAAQQSALYEGRAFRDGEWLPWHPISFEVFANRQQWPREGYQVRAALSASPQPPAANTNSDHLLVGASREASTDELEAVCTLTADEWRQMAESAEAALQEVMNALPGTTYMDPPDGGAPTIAEQVRRMAKDAGRYLWLRNHSAPTMDPADNGKPWCARCDLEAPGNELLWGAELDAAVDAASGASAGAQKPNEKSPVSAPPAVQAVALPVVPSDEQIDAVFEKWAGRNDCGVPYLSCYIEQFRFIAGDLLAASPQPAAAVQVPVQPSPVAWRVMKDHWVYFEQRPSWHETEGFEVEPLYAAPAAAPVQGEPSRQKEPQ